MDQDDLISDVYNKGDILLQSVSGSTKSRLEAQLAEFEQEWADFCKEVTNSNNVLKETKNDWIKVERTARDLISWSEEASNTVNTNVYTRSADVVVARQQLKSLQVSKGIFQNPSRGNTTRNLSSLPNSSTILSIIIKFIFLIS